MNVENEKEQVEREIEEAVNELSLDEERAPELLSKLELKPLRECIQRNYGDARGKARKYEPVPMAKTLIYKELLDIHSRNQVLRKLRNNLDDAQLLGYGLQNGVPQNQNIQYFISNKLDEDAQELIKHTVEKIEEKCRQKDLLIDVELVEEKAKGKEKSSRTKKRIKSDKTKEVSNFLRRHIIDDFSFPRSKNNKYDDLDFCEVLAFAGFQNMATNEAWDVLSGISDKDIPRSQTILKNIRDLDKSDIHQTFEKAIDKSVELEKREGRINGEVTVLIDKTIMPYYGDENDEGVVSNHNFETDGTKWGYKYVVAKAKVNGDNLILGAEPIKREGAHVKVTKKLLQKVKDRVKVKRVIADREFSNSKFIKVYENMNLEYVHISVMNSRIKEVIENNDAQTVKKHTFGEEEVTTQLVLKENQEGEIKPFITNAPKMWIFGTDLFEEYSQRWDIETGFDDIKNKFMPKTTSKNFKVRLFHFLFGILLYNLWTIVNTVVNLEINGEIKDEKIVTAKKFLTELIFNVLSKKRGYG